MNAIIKTRTPKPVVRGGVTGIAAAVDVSVQMTYFFPVKTEINPENPVEISTGNTPEISTGIASKFVFLDIFEAKFSDFA